MPKPDNLIRAREISSNPEVVDIPMLTKALWLEGFNIVESKRGTNELLFRMGRDNFIATLQDDGTFEILEDV
jgi:hypothetical protein